MVLRIVYTSWTFKFNSGLLGTEKKISSCQKQIALTYMWGANYEKPWQFEKKEKGGKKI
jgi:hypothetical protein